MLALPRRIVIGLSIAAAMGPMGVVCIRRSLADARSACLAACLAAGSGAATADAIYGANAGPEPRSTPFRAAG